MAITKRDPFDVQHPFPQDLRMQRDTLAELYAIPNDIRWEGMQCYVVQEKNTYYLKGGLANSNWQILISGSGGSTPTFTDNSFDI